MKKNLLIIGATSGIISSCLENLLEMNFKIYATYSRKESLKNIPQNILNSNNIKFLKLNLNQSNKKIINSIKKNKINADAIIYAVGGSFGIKEYSYNLKFWQKSLDLNIFKHILINNYFLKKMIKKKYGRILFFSTTAVDDKNASITYSASKAFLENYVKKSAIIFGKHNILINCLKTSIIAAKNNNWYKGTKQNPKRVNKIAKEYLSVERIGNSQDLLDYIKLIISSRNKFTNGSILSVDGGLKKF